MFRRLKIRRAARALHETHPEVSLPVARQRAWALVQRFPRASTWRLKEYLIHDHRISKMTATLNRNMHEASTEETP